MKLLHIFVGCILYRSAKAESEPAPSTGEPQNGKVELYTAAPLELIDVVPGVEETVVQPVIERKPTKEQEENIAVNVRRPDVQILPMPIAVGEPNGGHIEKPQILPKPIAVGEPHPGKDSVDFSLDGYFYRGAKKIASYRIDFRGVHFKKDSRKKNKTESVIDEVIDLVEGPDVDDDDEEEEEADGAVTTTESTEAPAITTEAVRPTPKKNEAIGEVVDIGWLPPTTAPPVDRETTEERHTDSAGNPLEPITAAPADRETTTERLHTRGDTDGSLVSKGDAEPATDSAGNPLDSVTAAPADKNTGQPVEPKHATRIMDCQTEAPQTPAVDAASEMPDGTKATEKTVEPKKEETPEIEDPVATTGPGLIGIQKTAKPEEPSKNETPLIEDPETTTGPGLIGIQKTAKPEEPSKNETPLIEDPEATTGPGLIGIQKTAKPAETKTGTPEEEEEEDDEEEEEELEATTGAGPIGGNKNTENPAERTKKAAPAIEEPAKPSAVPISGPVVYTGAPPKPEFGPGKCSKALVFAYDSESRLCLASPTQVCSEADWEAVKAKTFGACMRAAPKNELPDKADKSNCSNGFVYAKVPGEPSADLYGKICNDKKLEDERFCPKQALCVQEKFAAHCCVNPSWG